MTIPARAVGWSSRLRRDPLLGVVVLLGAWVAVYLSWTVLHWTGDATVVSDFAPIPLSIAAAGFAWWASRAVTNSRRVCVAWRLIALGCASWAAGECTWYYLEVIRHSQPFPSVADGFYLLFYPLMFAGLATMPVGRPRRGERVTFALDAATIMIATVMAVWYLVVGPTVHAHADSWFAEVLSLAYPAADLMLVLGVARLLLRRPGRGLSRPLWFLVAGAAALTVADISYARLSLASTYAPGTLPDALWALGLFMLVLAGYAQGRTLPASRPTVHTDARPMASKLPYVAVAGGLALLLYETTLDAQAPLVALVLGSLALTGVVVGRQIVVMRENSRLVEELHRIANADPLTGGLNRRRFFELGERVMSRSRLDDTPVAALMIDIDHFKTVNDRVGHGAGDDAIREVVSRCAASLRPDDLFARYGGDEFAVLVRITPALDADELARRIAESVASTPIMTAGGLINVTVSVGLAVSNGSETLEALLHEADIALYRAKRSGRNRHFGPLSSYPGAVAPVGS